MLKPHPVKQATRDAWYRQYQFVERFSKQSVIAGWEVSLLLSLKHKLLMGWDLSFKESSALRRIYKRVQQDVG